MGLGGVAIADPLTAMRLKVPFSDGLGGGKNECQAPPHHDTELVMILKIG